ncbi:ExeM/NucH family extracellular endonuclease [Nesterenkonia alkaliphila]|uniref:ExeM/NucH family extracellular endonuclease n=1 Tax=Nesterenkonia alkaliphila TaxID=1463631 RepID=A0A7K1UL22_9MICC|nr:ExeM/NucH family extracellular endonuclease [Nesterenkonia alkaliphila]MVT26711.1 ExeM/NucH family extracellular endonuclease [Nesterenkonia alkaliphila]GFZ76909.1 hypothetical protein GCM10011359_01170 [Nesterenkonia alkaliphila]
MSTDTVPPRSLPARITKSLASVGIVAALLGAPLAPAAAGTSGPAPQIMPMTGGSEAPGADCVVISEVNNRGGSGASPHQRYVELENTCETDVDLSGWSVQGYQANGNAYSGGEAQLAGSIPAGGNYLIVGPGNGQDPIEYDYDAGNILNFAGGGSSVVLFSTPEPVEAVEGDLSEHEDVVDALGWGDASLFIGAPALAANNPETLHRIGSTSDNSADFAPAAADPHFTGGPAAGQDEAPEPPADGESTVAFDVVYTQGAEPESIYSDRYVQLHNYGEEPVDLDGWSLQYTNASGSFNRAHALSGSIEAGGYYLIAIEGSNYGDDAGTSLRDHSDVVIDDWIHTFDYTLTLTTTGSVVDLEGAIDPEGREDVADIIGYGNAHAWSGSAPAETLESNDDVRAFQRTGEIEGPSLDNVADFVLTEQFVATNAAGEQLPGERGGDETPTPEDPEEVEIAEIRATTSLDPADAALYGESVTTRGVVTGYYSDAENDSRAHDGFYIQTPGACGEEAFDALPETSCAIFVYMGTSWDGAEVDPGDYVEVTAVVGSWRETGASSSAQLQLTGAEIEVLDEEFAEIVPVTYEGFVAVEDRPALLGMLIEPAGEWTITDNYSLLYGNPDNIGGWLGLVDGTEPLSIPTTIHAPGSEGQQALAQENAERLIWLDHGGRNRWASFAFDRHMPLPYLSAEVTPRVGAGVDFHDPVILEYRYDSWRFQPTAFLPGSPEAEPVTFEDTRTDNAAPPAREGDVRLAGFNVLNYFPNVGEDEAGCEFHEDRFGNPTTANWCTVRGAYTQEHFETQQARIVNTIIAMDADVVALQEIENSGALDHLDLHRDYAHEVLVAALNAVEGEGTWDFVPVEEHPENEDVIRNGYIYKPEAVEFIDSVILFEDGVTHLGDLAEWTTEGQTLDEVYSNAREPMAAVFQPVDGTEDDRFVTVVNHFKSKGGSGDGDNVETGGEGAFNGDRTRQAAGLVAFSEELAEYYETDRIYLMGDFNSYDAETPLQVIEEGGYVNLSSQPGQWSYQFGSEVGSLDHVFATDSAAETVVQTEIWSTNAAEPIALEYSRYEASGTEGIYGTEEWNSMIWRASDHDPIIADIVVGTETEPEIEIDQLAVSVVGDGERTGNEGVPVNIHLFEADGTLNGITGIPYAGDEDGQHRFVLGADRDQAGALQLSADGSTLVIGGYDADLGASTNGALTELGTERVVAAIRPDGTVDVSTSLAGAFSGGHIRGVAALDGTRYWVAGHGNNDAQAPYDAGVLTVEAGGDDPSVVVPGSSGQLRNHRVPGIYNDQLYVSSDRSNYSGIVQVGTGVPTETISEEEFVVIAATPEGRDTPHDFVFAGDYLYVAFTEGEEPALVRYAEVDGAWEPDSAYPGEFWGVEAAETEAGVAIYATRGSGFGNELVQILDTDGLDEAESEVIATAEENYAFRGVAFAPDFQPGGAVEVDAPAPLPADIDWEVQVPYGEGDALSAVLGAETNPQARFVLGSDEISELGAVEFQITSGDQDVVTGDGVVITSNEDGSYTLAAEPVSSGITELEITAVLDGEEIAESTLRYWVSDSLPLDDALAHVGIADASTAQDVGEGYLLVGDDDTLGIRLYGPTFDVPVNFFPIEGEDHEHIPYERGPGETWDIESSARMGDTIFWLGSIGNSRSGNVRPDRDTIAATELSGSGADAELETLGYARGFKEALVEWDNADGHGLGAGAFQFERAIEPGYSVEGPNSLNVEGAAIAPDGESLWLAFRSPLVDPETGVGSNDDPGSEGDHALIIEIADIYDVTVNGAEIEITDYHLLDLDGRAIRGMANTGDGYYAIQAGSADDAGNFAIFGWTGDPEDAPVQSVNELSMWDKDGSYESLPLVPNLQDGTTIRVVQDVGTVDLYDNGLEAQSLTPEFMKFFTHDYVLDFQGAFEDDDAADPDPEITLSASAAEPGEEITVEGTGFAAGEQLTLRLNPELGTVEADAEGEFTTTVTIPEETDPAQYAVQALNAEAEVLAEAPLTVLDPAGGSTPDPTEDPTADPTPDPTEDPTADPTGTPTASPTEPGETDEDGEGGLARTGAAVGAVLGGALLLVLLGLILHHRARRASEHSA